MKRDSNDQFCCFHLFWSFEWFDQNPDLFHFHSILFRIHSVFHLCLLLLCIDAVSDRRMTFYLIFPRVLISHFTTQTSLCFSGQFILLDNSIQDKMNSYYIECTQRLKEKQLLREYLISDGSRVVCRVLKVKSETQSWMKMWWNKPDSHQWLYSRPNNTGPSQQKMIKDCF